MKLIVITDETNHVGEMETLIELLARGASVHIRKPQLSTLELQAYLSGLPLHYRQQISLHAHHDLAQKFRLGGYHLKSDQELEGPWLGRLSKSFHTVSQLEHHDGELDYAFLSPIFDTISKRNYSGSFDFQVLKEKLPVLKQKTEVFALGGVDKDKVPVLAELGFSGAATIGAIWTQPDVKTRVQAFENFITYV